MYKVPIIVLEDCKSIIESLIDKISEHDELSSLLDEVIEAKKMIKLLEDNYYV